MQLDLYDEAARQLQLCNACRYCEGYCAVWEALDRRNEVGRNDVLYFSSLCHDCGQCFTVCPFTEPHEYDLNIPKALGSVRLDSYSANIRPGFMTKLIEFSSIATSIVIALSMTAMFLFVLFNKGTLTGNFTFAEVISPFEYRLVTVSIYAYVLILWGIEGHRYWSQINNGIRLKAGLGAIFGGLADAFGHENFKGGGAGCTYPDSRNRKFRLIFHPMVFFGFLVALVSISFYPSFGLPFRVVYLLGSGMMFAGASGLLYGKIISGSAGYNSGMRKIDLPFTLLLNLGGLTGVLLVLFYGFGFDWSIFLVHDAFIFTLFLLAPFGKFIHPIFRILALIKNRMERSIDNNSLPR
jgi:citrate/tricarballylate utilization protein